MIKISSREEAVKITQQTKEWRQNLKAGDKVIYCNFSTYESTIADFHLTTIKSIAPCSTNNMYHCINDSGCPGLIQLFPVAGCFFGTCNALGTGDQQIHKLFPLTLLGKPLIYIKKDIL